MKRVYLLLILLLCPSIAEASTTHYAYVLPTVGASPNQWGGLLNTAIADIDTNIWQAANGTTIGVNAPSASGSNITLTNPINNIQNIAFTGTGKALILPAMNATASPVVGGTITVNNVGSYAFEIFANDTSTAVVTSLAPSSTAYITLLTNGTTNGTFQVDGPYLINGVAANFSTVAIGTSTASVPLTVVGASSLGGAVTTTGAIGIGTAATNELDVYGAVAIGTSYAGVVTSSSNGLSVQGSVSIGTSTPTATLTLVGDAASAPTTLTISTSTFTPTFNTSNNFNITLVHASCPCTVANPSGTIVPGQSGLIIVNQSATGSDTIGTWGSYYQFSNGTAPTLSTGASAIDLLPYYAIDATHIAIGFSGNY